MSIHRSAPIVPVRLIEVGALSLIVVLLTASSAKAYIDPGTGSLLLQIVAAVFLAGIVTFKRWWRIVVGVFRTKSPDDSPQDDPLD